MTNTMKDYKNNVLKPQVGFIKTHWKGWVLVSILATVATFLFYFGDNVKEFCKEKFSKKEDM